MPRPSEDDREAIDRAFADLVAGYHLTADRQDPLKVEDAVAEPESSWADEHPLFRYQPDPEPVAEDSEDEEEDAFEPEDPAPLPNPAWPVLVAWLALGYAVLATLIAVIGVRLPSWAGWLAVCCFVGGLAILVTRLPRHRPPDASNGAVL